MVVETPQVGHATYVSSRPRSMDSFLYLYDTITKDDTATTVTTLLSGYASYAGHSQERPSHSALRDSAASGRKGRC